MSKVASVDGLLKLIDKLDAVWLKLACKDLAERRELNADEALRNLTALASNYQVDYMTADDCIVLEDEW